MTSRSEPQPAKTTPGWLTFIYRVPSEPASRRTFVWRRLKGLGAVYLQQAAAVLPATEANRAALDELARRIREFGGEASLLLSAPPDEASTTDLIERFNHARDAEYTELVDTAGRLEAEIRREVDRGKLTYAELEEIEADWSRIRRWHERVRARDTFGAPGATAARMALASARRALDGFRGQVYEREGLTDAEGVTLGETPAGDRRPAGA